MCSSIHRRAGLLSAAVLLVASSALAQTAVVRPRVLLVVDTSSSMLEEVSSVDSTGGDGSLYYESGVMTRTGMYRGFLAGAPVCPNPVGGPFRGVTSRFHAAKQAIANVVNASGDIDWGLMRYAGTECGDPDGDGVFDAFSSTPSYASCTIGPDCFSQSCTGGRCDCASDGDCDRWEFCIGGSCGRDPNLCGELPTGAGETATRVGAICGNQPSTVGVTQSGGCGLAGTAGSPGCATPQSCYADGDCFGPQVGRCALVGAGPARVCACVDSVADCPSRYTCDAGRCVYNRRCAADGGYLLVDPSKPGYRADQVLPWTDGIEIYRSNGSGRPINPELHPSHGTAVGGSARSALKWYEAIKAAGVASPLHDKQLQCRPYILVLLTDGADTCDEEFGGNDSTGPAAAVQGFVAATAPGARLRNRVEVIGFNIGSVSSQNKLNEAARAGDPNRLAARYVNNQTDLEAALGDIVASAVLTEQCNGLDDNCNELVDEGLGVYEECVPGGPACLAGPCDPTGRCPCNGTLTNQCDPGFVCDHPLGAGLCVPSCTLGVGSCERSGVRKCGGSCCVNDGQASCTPIVAGAPVTEICNNLDDNCNAQIDEGTVCSVCQPTVEICNGLDDDCNGIVDDHLVDVGVGCGTDEGECVAGLTACQATASNVFPHATDHIVCTGSSGPAAEVCDGRDNNCDGVTDGMTRACYTGAALTRLVGACRDGAQLCNAAPGSGTLSYDTCIGQILPALELCNGLDDDCNGVIDDVSGTNVACCTSGRCGVGLCKAGHTQCSGGVISCVNEIGPQQELCDGIDNDCSGTVDDVAGLGAACTPASGSCSGQLVCDGTLMQLVCQATAASPEICNGFDDDCDGAIDEAVDVQAMDGRIGQACDTPIAPADLPPCKAGTTTCLNGQVSCEGAVLPSPNVCGKVSTDCQTSGIFNGACPSGFDCSEGICVAPCGGGEFPCPGGFVCRAADRVCIPDVCAKLSCAAGTFCALKDDGSAECVDPCANLTCPDEFRCKEGLCIDDSCKAFGCPTGQVCVGTVCEADRCFEQRCDVGAYCSPVTGECVNACVGPCPPGEQCEDGLCAADPCEGLRCLGGQTCLVAAGVASCVDNQCAGSGCNLGSVCCGGGCVDDPCLRVGCPGGAACQVNSRCQAACVAAPYDKVVGAGGGGFACDMAGVGVAGRAPTPGWLFLSFVFVVQGVRRRRIVAAGG